MKSLVCNLSELYVDDCFTIKSNGQMYRFLGLYRFKNGVWGYEYESTKVGRVYRTSYDLRVFYLSW